MSAAMAPRLCYGTTPIYFQRLSIFQVIKPEAKAWSPDFGCVGIKVVTVALFALVSGR